MSNSEALLTENLSLVNRRVSCCCVMVCECFTYDGVGELVLVDDNMDHADYIAILEQNPQQSIQNIHGDANMQFIFQQDN